MIVRQLDAISVDRIVDRELCSPSPSELDLCDRFLLVKHIEGWCV
jgi:hypothetical protein